jgi:hypothetical protein
MSIDKSNLKTDLKFNQNNVDIYNILIDIKQSLKNLENNFEKVNTRLDNIEKEIHDNKIDCQKMRSHISFVENTYDSLKRPLFFFKNQVERVIGHDKESEKQMTIEEK